MVKNLLWLLLLLSFSANAQQADPATLVHAGWISIAPPLLAIAFALIFRQVIPALFIGVWLGAWAVQGMTLQGLWLGLLETTETYVLNALADRDHGAIILFSLMIGGMVGIISRNGGMQGVVNRIAGWASSSRRASLATAGMGLAVFFDDYANTLVVGNTMRPITDKMRLSREKLAYIVDSTAAPVACLAFVTTWIGYEVGLIDDALDKLGADVDAYGIFLASIPYSFYPILAITFVFMVALSRRDFGAMLRAEQRARRDGVVTASVALAGLGVTEEAVEPIEGRPHRAINAVLPVLTLIVGVIAGLLVTGGGEGKSLRAVIGDADSYKALLWGSSLSVLVAAALSLGQRVLSLSETVEAWLRGVRSMLMAMVILVLAWALAGTTDALNTAGYLASLLGDDFPVGILPGLVFVLAAATAFSTGSSWGTMAILMPLVVPLLWALLGGIDPNPAVFYSAIAGVLAGAVWGDHCSPISDTTILSSMASGCDHIEHVRTQLPYAMVVGLVALLVGILPTGFGIPWWISLLACGALLYAILHFAGRSPEAT